MLKNYLALLSGLLCLTSSAFAASPEPAAAVKTKPPLSAQPAEPAAEAVPFRGVWEGRFTGDSEGNIKVTVGADGTAKVTCVTDESGRTFEMSGPVEASGAVTAIENSFGPAGIKVRFKGKLTNRGTASGLWDNAFFSLKGDWQATRKGDLPKTAPAAK